MHRPIRRGAAIAELRSLDPANGLNLAAGGGSNPSNRGTRRSSGRGFALILQIQSLPRAIACARYTRMDGGQPDPRGGAGGGCRATARGAGVSAVVHAGEAVD